MDAQLYFEQPFSAPSFFIRATEIMGFSGLIIIASYNEVHIFRELVLIIKAFDNKVVGDI